MSQSPTTRVSYEPAGIPRAPRSARGFSLALPALIIIAICCASPLVWSIAAMLGNPRAGADLRLNAFRLDLLGRTLSYNMLAAVIATAMGLPVGIVLGRGRGWLARSLWVVVPAALFMPSLAFAYGWSQVVRLAGSISIPTSLFTPLLPSYYGTSSHIRLLNAPFVPGGIADVLRCVWTLAAWLWAVPACLIGLALRRLDTTVQQHALLDGALARITLRQLAGPIIASLAAVTVLATQEFSVYEPTGISVIATEVRMVFETGAFSSTANPITATGMGGSGVAEKGPNQQARAAAAIATALPLLAVTALLAGLGTWGAGRLATTNSIAVGDWPRVLDARWWMIALAWLLVLINIGVPVAALILSAKVKLSPVRIWDDFSEPVEGALFVGAITALIAGCAALSASARWTRGMLAIAIASFLIGGQLMAIAMIRLCNRPGLFWAYNRFPILAATYIGRFGWVALASARGTWSTAWTELRDVAATDGANPAQTARSVIWPIAWPTLLAGSLLVGALSLTEVPATVLIQPQKPQVLTTELMTWVHMVRYDPMIEASLLMMLMVIVPVAVAIVLVSIAGRARRRLLRRSG